MTALAREYPLTCVSAVRREQIALVALDARQRGNDRERRIGKRNLMRLVVLGAASRIASRASCRGRVSPQVMPATSLRRCPVRSNNFAIAAERIANLFTSQPQPADFIVSEDAVAGLLRERRLDASRRRYGDDAALNRPIEQLADYCQNAVGAQSPPRSMTASNRSMTSRLVMSWTRLLPHRGRTSLLSHCSVRRTDEARVLRLAWRSTKSAATALNRSLPSPAYLLGARFSAAGSNPSATLSKAS